MVSVDVNHHVYFTAAYTRGTGTSEVYLGKPDVYFDLFYVLFRED